MSMSEYIKHCRHFDGLGMGDAELESQAKALEDQIKELQDKAHILPAKNNALRVQIERKDRIIDSLKAELIATFDEYNSTGKLSTVRCLKAAAALQENNNE